MHSVKGLSCFALDVHVRVLCISLSQNMITFALVPKLEVRECTKIASSNNKAYVEYFNLKGTSNRLSNLILALSTELPKIHCR
jgi:hypothetical protein